MARLLAILPAALLLWASICLADDSALVRKAADEIKSAIEKADARALMVHAQESTYFVDELYWKKELAGLLAKKGSWLRRNLFEGDDSVRNYLLTARDLKVEFEPNGSECLIVFRSSNHPPHEWPWCSVSIKNGKWMFGDMFAHR